MKNKISDTFLSFKPHKTYTPEEILAAGGTTAFGLKSGKNNSTLLQTLTNSAPIETFTVEEWEQTLKQFKERK